MCRRQKKGIFMSYLKRAWAETHLDRIKNNVENYKKYLKPETELLCVVKANCYGNGDDAIVPYLENELNVNWFAVSNIEEAMHFRGNTDFRIHSSRICKGTYKI